MASVTIDAEYAARHCKARLSAIEAQYERDKAEWFSDRRKMKRRRGVWPFKYDYYPTDAELEDIFYGRGQDQWDWWYPDYRLRTRYADEEGALRRIIRAAEVAIDDWNKRCPDVVAGGCGGVITLNDGESALFRKLIDAPLTAEAA